LLAAAIAEAEAWVNRSPQAFTAAADRYADMKMPYEEARCRLEAGEVDGARAIIRRLGIEQGPLGQRLSQLGAASPV
jgi:hypothetical protein